jgi:hypothetical protein
LPKKERAVNATIKSIACLLAGVMGAAASTASAADRLRGTVDGEERQWQVLASHGESTAYFRDMNGLLEVTIQGHADARFTTKGALSISMLAMDGQLPFEAEVMYFPEAAMLPNFNSDGQDGELELERFEQDGDRLYIRGRYRGSLGYVETIRPRVEPTRHIDVDLEFDLALPRQD